MLFQTQVFILVFLPAAVLAYYAAAKSVPARQCVLIAASLVFYAWWDARFVPLLLGQIGVSWLLACLHKKTQHPGCLIAGIVVNLASLATFKYLDFLIASLTAVTGVALPRAQLTLPIGISFFSFQLISYLIDRMRGDAPVYPFRQFALFVLLFPHLIAGPIVRHNELVPQFALDPLRPGLWSRLGAGLTIFTIGFAKKVLVADKLAEYADTLFAQADGRLLSFGESWNAALTFSFQLFLDFSAYTEMAIGIALLFGLVLPENFRRPYLASDLRDFWRRWHITLSNFIRDYLYIPLGGSRRGELRYIVATLGSMSICGLWHGAGWTYVAWGAWHGLGLIVCRSWQRAGFRLPLPVGWFATMLFVAVGWVLFRAADFSAAASILQSMAGVNGFGGAFRGTGLIMIAALLSALLPSAHEVLDRWLRPAPAAAIALAILATFCVLEVGKGPPVNFIYFQF